MRESIRMKSRTGEIENKYIAKWEGRNRGTLETKDWRNNVKQRGMKRESEGEQRERQNLERKEVRGREIKESNNKFIGKFR